jgi:hypothetical protein
MLRFIRNALALGVLVLATQVFAPQVLAQVYKSVDEQGRVIYTDQKPKDKPAEAIDLPATNTAPAPAVTDTSEAAAKPASTKVRYTRFAITSPANEQTLDYGTSAVDVTLVLEPALQEGHQIQFVLDGKPFDRPGSALSTRFGNLARGTHAVEARVVAAANGKAVKSTGVVRFTIQLHSDQYQADESDDYHDNYPYGARSARGARGARGAGEPGSVSGNIGASGDIGAGSPDGVISPEEPYVPARPVSRRRH